MEHMQPEGSENMVYQLFMYFMVPFMVAAEKRWVDILICKKTSMRGDIYKVS